MSQLTGIKDFWIFVRGDLKMEPCEIDTGRVRQFSHTADIGIIARANNLEGLFSLCCSGLVEVIAGRSIKKLNADLGNGLDRRHLELKMNGHDLENLLVTFLTEILYRLEADNLLVLSSFVNLNLEENSLRVSFECVEYDSEEHGYFREVKAVTYHQISIEKCEDETWAARVIFDL